MTKIIHIAHSVAHPEGRFILPAVTAIRELVTQPDGSEPLLTSRTYNGARPKGITDALAGVARHIKGLGYNRLAAIMGLGGGKDKWTPGAYTLRVIIENDSFELSIVGGRFMRDHKADTLDTEIDKVDAAIPPADVLCARIKSAKGVAEAIKFLESKVSDLSKDADQ